MPLPKREDRLRRALADLPDNYQYIILDCPPSASLIAQNALAAADWILAPVEVSNFAIAGLGDFYRWVEALRDVGVHDEPVCVHQLWKPAPGGDRTLRDQVLDA